jgi:hypothetical protein
VAGGGAAAGEVAELESGDAVAALVLEPLEDTVAGVFAESAWPWGFLSSAKPGSANKNIPAQIMAARSTNRMSAS